MNIHKTVSWVLFFINALLIVFLVFGNRMVFPPLLQSFGRMHPLLLHIPIGTVLIALVFLPFRKQFEKATFDKAYFALLTVAAITASITALMGLILAGEGGYNEDALNAHKISGTMLAVAVNIVYTSFLNKEYPEEVTRIVFKAGLGASAILLIVAGHFGSILTHGDDFVFEPLMSKENEIRSVTDSTSLYSAAIGPVLDQKCGSCHNEKKSKGDLTLTSLAGIARGGEHGAVWIPGHPLSSRLMKLILLPESHDDHMPPAGKAQLTSAEVQLLFQWILSGADTTKAWTKYAASDSVRKLAEQFIFSANKTATGAQYTFDPAPQAAIEKLNDPYRTVTPIASNEPALAATFFIRKEYQSAKLEELTSVKEQLVSLNLSRMPVTDDDCKTISKLSNLERLNLNFSSITEKGLQYLSSLEELTQLSIAGTSIDASGIQKVKEFKKLKEIFVWNTPITASEMENLKKSMPSITWNTGFVPDANEKLRLTPPIPVSDKTIYDASEPVTLTHKLPGTVIRYTTDGTDPDSVSGKLYEKPFDLSGYTIVKTRACKEGWFCSPVGTFVLYAKGIAPTDTKLLTKPNKDYKGEGASTLSNNRKGFIDDHHDIAWIGFRENPMHAEFRFSPGTKVKSITVSYDRNLRSWLFPPSKLEVWGGADPEHMKLLSQVNPEQPTGMEFTRNDALVIPVNGDGFETYRIVAYPVNQLPKWHPSNNPKTKDKRAWLFVDEIIFQ